MSMPAFVNLVHNFPQLYSQVEKQVGEDGGQWKSDVASGNPVAPCLCLPCGFDNLFQKSTMLIELVCLQAPQTNRKQRSLFGRLQGSRWAVVLGEHVASSTQPAAQRHRDSEPENVC